MKRSPPGTYWNREPRPVGKGILPGGRNGRSIPPGTRTPFNRRPSLLGSARGSNYDRVGHGDPEEKIQTLGKGHRKGDPKE